jgi:hypothetical protein
MYAPFSILVIKALPQQVGTSVSFIDRFIHSNSLMPLSIVYPQLLRVS